MSGEDHPNAAGGSAATGTYNPCEGVLMVAGESFRCDWPLGPGGHHRGWAHTNAAAQAVWAGPSTDHVAEHHRHADMVRDAYR